MAIVFTFESLAEAAKLVQTKLLQGLIETIIEEGQLLQRFPVFTMDTATLEYNREVNLPEADFFDIGDPIPWTGNQEYEKASCSLKRVAKAKGIDKFLEKTYRDPNDLKALTLNQLRKGCMRTMEDKIIYGNSTTNAKEFDGLHKLVSTGMQIHQGSSTTGAPLSIFNLRKLIDMHKSFKPDLLLMTYEVARRLDAYITTSYKTGDDNVVMPVGTFSLRPSELGMKVESFQGIPILRSDYLKQTEAISGNAFSAKTGGATSSIFSIKFGQIMEGGVCMGLGGETGGTEFFMVYEFPVLEQFDAGGIRLVAYMTLAMGNNYALGRIDGITDAAVVN
jgi:hypothetical protein